MTISRQYLFGGDAPWSKQDWTATDDRVRGGSSVSYISIKASTVDDPNTPTSSSSAFFHGHLDTSTLGGAGFASQRTTDTRNWHLEKYDGVELTIGKSDGKRYSFVLKDEILPKRPDGREQSSLSWEFDFVVPPPKEEKEATREGTVLRVKWCEFKPTYRGRPQEGLGRCIAANDIKRVSFMMRRFSSLFPQPLEGSQANGSSFFDQQQGDFEIEIKSVAAFKEGDQVEAPAPVRQDGEDMTEKLRQRQHSLSSSGRAESMVSEMAKDADESKPPQLRGRPRNPLLRFLSSCCRD